MGIKLVNFNETICAVATPHGVGAQSTIKVSGKEATTLVQKIFKPAKAKTSLKRARGYTAHYGWLYDPRDGSTIDDAIVLVFKALKGAFSGID